MGEDIHELIRQLSNFRTRKTAKTTLVNLGESCVGEVCRELTGPLRDNVKWNLIDILSAIGSPKALPALKSCAEDPTFEIVCNEAIAEISSDKSIGDTDAAQVSVEETSPLNAETEELGIERQMPPRPGEAQPSVPDVEVVEKIVEKVVQVARKPLTVAQVKDILDVLLAEQAFEEIKEVKDGDKHTGYKFAISTSQGRRRQRVSVVFDSTDEDKNQVVTLYSVCCEADPKYFEDALRWNQNIASGSICLTDMKKRPHFILLKHLAMDRVSKESLLETITSLGNRADQIEKVLTGAQDIR